MQRSQVKVMLITFFDHYRLVHHEFDPQGQTVNQLFYKEALTHLVNKICQKRRAFWGQKKTGFCTTTMLLPTQPSA